MTDQNIPQPPSPGAGAWNAPPQPVPPPPAPPSTGYVAQPSAPPAWAPTPPPPGVSAQGFNPTPVRTRGRWGTYRRGGIRGNGIYSMVVGIISILVPLVSLLVMGNGHFTFLVLLPVLGLIYGIMSVVQGRRRAFGIIGIVLCAVALVLELLLLA